MVCVHGEVVTVAAVTKSGAVQGAVTAIHTVSDA
jgi:hypothetical protein